MGGMLRELDPASVVMQQSVKRALDPRNLFNPGKVIAV
jgi:FAD/FMN-containing dehydrogenase